MLNPQVLSVRQSVHTKSSFEISSLADNMITIMTDKRTQQGLGITSVVLMTFAIYVMCVAMRRNFKEKGLRPKAKEILFPLFMIALTSMLIRDIKDSMVNPQSTASIVKTSPNKVMDKSNSQSEAEAKISPYLRLRMNSYLINF
jgi:hypothetical protein